MRFRPHRTQTVLRHVVAALILLGLALAPEPARADEAPTVDLLEPSQAAIDALFGLPDAAGAPAAVAPAAADASVPRSFLPMVMRPGVAATPAPPDRNDTLAYINYFRAMAKVPLVNFNADLNNNCWLHARYMAEENHLTHDERTTSPWYTTAGQSCGQRGNAWLGSASSQPYWQSYNAIDGWMASTGHRLWLLYPTTPTFGFGFYTAPNNRAAAALDVLTFSDSGADASYANWPVRYPGPGQVDVPAQPYPITLHWRYFGPTPTVSGVSLKTASGQDIAHTVTTALPVSHKGIEIRPAGNLPANTTIDVTVTGSYDGRPFTQSWSFKTAK